MTTGIIPIPRNLKIVPAQEIPGKELLKDEIGNDQRSDKDGGENEVDVECQCPFLLRQLDVIHTAKIMKIRIMVPSCDRSIEFSYFCT